ncbi:c-type cytochrome domain-containing protein [Pirellulaceae bacterium SH449]
MEQNFEVKCHRIKYLGLSMSIAMLMTSSAALLAQEPVNAVGFREHVAPILVEKCIACHSAKKAEGGYRLDTFQELMKPGDSGENPVAASESSNSLLLHRIQDSDPETRMPPEQDPLTEDEIAAIVAWIDSGAVFDGEDPTLLLPLQSLAKTYADPPAYYPAIPIYTAAVTKDGKYLLTGGFHEVLVWNLADGKPTDEQSANRMPDRRISNLGQRIFAIALNDAGDRAAVACGEPGRIGEVRLIDLQTLQVTAVLARALDVALDVAFRPGTNEIAVAFADNSIRLIDTDTNSTIKSYSTHADWVTAIAFSPDGKRLASASRDKSVKVLDLESGEMILNYAGHTAPVRGVVFSPDGTQVFSTGDDKRLHRWNVADGGRAADVLLSGQGSRLVRHGGFVYVPTSAKQLHKLDTSNNQVVQTFSGHKDWVHAAAITPAELVIGVAHDAEIKLWAQDGTLQANWLGTPWQVGTN